MASSLSASGAARLLWMPLLWVLLTPVPAGAAQTNSTRGAKLKVSGFGPLGNRELKKTVRLMRGKSQAPPLYDADFVEDAALIILSALNRNGYLQPRLSATLTLADGSVKKLEWDKNLETVLPRPLAAKKVRFRVRRGVLYHYKRIDIAGLGSLSQVKARSLFVEAGFLVPLKGTRIYTPSKLQRSIDDLAGALEREGFENASVTATRFERNDTNGQVRVQITVREGFKTLVRSVRMEVYAPDETSPHEISMLQPQKPYSRLWLQDFVQGLRAKQYRKGFPDAAVEVSTIQRATNDTNVEVALLAQVKTGRQIDLGNVRYEGNRRTKLSVMESRVDLKPGEGLDPIKVERGRNRLSRLGAFESVGIRYEILDDETRDVIYELKEGAALDFSLLFGYGSYELLRGGFELDHKNAFGLAHQSRLRATQSFKSTSADFLYTLPAMFHEDVDVFLNASGLRREELSFVREEYGGGGGVGRSFRPISTAATLRYNYQFLNALDNQAAVAAVERTRVGAIVLDLKHDRRDNPLLPRRGYNAFANVEVASESLGGDVDYQRIELAASYHANLVGGLFLHLGLRHGVAFHRSGTNSQLPFVKRFFPGGENSVRGYQQGEASPRDADGNLLGAESYLLGNVELEQFLTPSLSMAVFADGVGFAEHRIDYPARDALYSAGGGLRWKTLIGPVRFEYGHNLNPRPGDPKGTFHFSVGFPF
ncbi:MAG TPA: BamA/TamA family outer membrane protein [Verrucomicrobiae bacterium]|nr:BamA/TamA family outer membrane protein [Verrucomicrobiae bacterium]